MCSQEVTRGWISWNAISHEIIYVFRCGLNNTTMQMPKPNTMTGKEHGEDCFLFMAGELQATVGVTNWKPRIGGARLTFYCQQHCKQGSKKLFHDKKIFNNEKWWEFVVKWAGQSGVAAGKLSGYSIILVTHSWGFVMSLCGYVESILHCFLFYWLLNAIEMA